MAILFFYFALGYCLKTTSKNEELLNLESIEECPTIVTESLSSNFFIYPNPVGGEQSLKIQFNQISSEYLTLQIFNQQDRKLFEGTESLEQVQGEIEVSLDALF